MFATDGQLFSARQQDHVTGYFVQVTPVDRECAVDANECGFRRKTCIPPPPPPKQANNPSK
jgi:hypothetical protein